MRINTKELLGREEIIWDGGSSFEEINNKRILVTGAAGSIGRELVRQIILQKPGRLVLVDNSEIGIFNLWKLYGSVSNIEIKLADISDMDEMMPIFSHHKPQIVFHTAAYKHVPLMEHFPDKAIKNNLLGTKLIADLSVSNLVEKFVFISTDKAVNPTSVMGFTKRLAEMYIQGQNKNLNSFTQFIITRFGNVLGSSGSVYAIFSEQIHSRKPVTVTHPDASRYFMTLSEAAQLVREAAAIGKGGEILIFKMGKSVGIPDLVKRMIRLAGLIPGKDIQIEFTGLRGGEKLHEDLVHDHETLLTSRHPYIDIVNFSDNCATDMQGIVSQLQDAIKTESADELILMLKNLLREATCSDLIIDPVEQKY